MKEMVRLQQRPQLDELSMTLGSFCFLCRDIHIFLSNAICLLDCSVGELQCDWRS